MIPMSEWSKNAPAFIKVLNAIDRSAAVPVGASNPELVRAPLSDPYIFHKNAEVLRVDYNISPNTNFFFRWADDAQNEQQPLGIFTTTSYPIYPQYRAKPGASWSWNLVNVISPRITNEAIFTYNHLTQIVDITDAANPDLYDRTKLGFTFQELYPNSNLRNRFPQFSCGVGACSFNDFPAGWLSEGKTFAFTDNFAWNLGAHAVKFGGLWNRNDNGQQPSWTDALNINFAPNTDNPNDTGNQFANMLLGNYTQISQTNGRFFGTFRFYGYEFFGQDSWKVNRRLTLEMGLRWAYYGPTYTYGQFLQNYFDPALYNPAEAVQIDISNTIRKGSIIPGSGDPFNGLVQEGNGIPLGFSKHRYNNWQPRFGFAIDPTGSGKTAIRGGGGIFHERIRQNVNNFDGLGNPPLSYTPRLYGGNIDNVSPALVATGTRFPVTLSTFDKEGQIPTIYAWSFGVQRELGARTSIDVSYVGNMGRYLQYRRDLNQLPLGTTTSSPSPLTAANGTNDAIRTYKGFSSVNFTEYGAISNYNALQTRLSRRFARSFTANVNYTWSKAMAEIDTDGTAIGYFLDRHREYGPAGYDRTHVFTFDYVYELPTPKNNAFTKTVLGGWQVSGITRFWSGYPLNLTSNADPGTLGGGVRPNYLGGNPYADDSQRWQYSATNPLYLNPFVFSRPAQGSLGNLGKNVLRGPGINQWDMSLFKNTRISERVNVQLRFETFNTFNHTQWNQINVTMNAPNPGEVLTPANRGQAGQVNNTRDPRTLQLGLKVLF